MSTEPLPVDAVLPELRAALTTHGRAVLCAPPGAGKTTRVPLDLLAAGLSGRLVVLEPRRVAARAAARRLAAGLDEQLGATVGLTTRDERRVSRNTRIEVVTEGVLLRRLQRDPELPGTGLLLFDEFHERNLEADLALAFALEVRATLRPDLALLVASATLEVDRVADLLGGAPVLRAAGRSHPVHVEQRARPVGRSRELTDAVVDAVLDALDGHGGDVLVFLPGAAEIGRAERRLNDLVDDDVEVLPLHGRLPAAAQDRAVAAGVDGRRRIVLATDLAESSLTIPGVRTVVDAGLVREPRFDPARGMTGLVTREASRAAAEQRAGRAGRTAPGRCLRLWSAAEHAIRDPHPRPAITTGDLTAAALEVAAWGTTVTELGLLDPPPPAHWERARDTLTQLGALGPDGQITPHGRALAALPTHPRIGHLLLRGRELGLAALACELAAVLAERDPLLVAPDRPHADLAARILAVRGERAPPGATLRRGARAAARREAQRLAHHLDVVLDAPQDPEQVGLLVALGWPDRVAARRGARRGTFTLAQGRSAQLPEDDPLADEPLLAVANLDRGAQQARIHLAAPVELAALRTALADRISHRDEVGWQHGDVVARRSEQLGGLVLREAPLADPPADAVLAALLTGLREEGLGLLDWSAGRARQLQTRIAFLRRTLGEDWPEVGDAALLAELDTTVAPFLLHARRRADLARLAAADVLRARLGPGQARELDRLAPTHLTLPSGRRRALEYPEGQAPVLAVRIQEVLGAARTPTVAGGRVAVVVHLLSPAGRPVQVTDDLAGFWDRAYPQVRAELRGRYPKHAWPEDPRRGQGEGVR